MLADALVAAGDPRGEFIQLQMAVEAGRGNAWMETRANQLLTEHLAAWGRPFGAHVNRASLELRGGFAYRVTTDGTAGWTPEWSTLEELQLTHEGTLDMTEAIARLPLLRVLFAPDRTLDRMSAGGRAYPSIRAIGGSWIPGDRRAFPDLAVVLGQWHSFRDVGGLELVQRRAADLGLDAIVHACIAHVPEHVQQVVAARALGPPETRCLVLDPDHIDHARQGWYVRTWRERDDAIVGFRGSAWFETHTMRQVVEPLVAAGVARIAFAIPPLQRARSAKELAAVFDELRRAGVEIGEAPPSDVLAPATVGA